MINPRIKPIYWELFSETWKAIFTALMILTIFSVVASILGFIVYGLYMMVVDTWPWVSKHLWVILIPSVIFLVPFIPYAYQYIRYAYQNTGIYQKKHFFDYFR